jgi:hypothetical protein
MNLFITLLENVNKSRTSANNVSLMVGRLQVMIGLVVSVRLSVGHPSWILSRNKLYIIE